MMRPKGPTEKEQWRLMARYGTIGIEMGLCVTFGFLAGGWIDDRFGTTPWGVNLGLVFGIVAAFKALWRMYQTIVEDDKTTAAQKAEQHVDP